MRDAALQATTRAEPRRGRQVAPATDEVARSNTAAIDPEVLAAVDAQAPSSRAARYRERLASAAEALDRGRYADAKRMVQPVIRDLPGIALGHELAGLALYRMGLWRAAAAELEHARALDGSVHHLPVLADCYRALRRYAEVEALWGELRQASPNPALMAEGRIVVAGAHADRGDLHAALAVMGKANAVPKTVKDHHLRQWYVIGDLHDRLGDVLAARRFFALVQRVDPHFVDVAERIAALGR